jgi:hypothetical protein
MMAGANVEGMVRTKAKFTQADVARSIRAAKQAGAISVELLPDGTIHISLTAEDKKTVPLETEQEVEL